MANKSPRIMIVDDDPLNNLICKKIITRLIPGADVTTFTDPETGLIYIKSIFGKPGAGRAVLFLDINMPTMTGWEFMEQYERSGTTIKKQLSIYILSSSVNPTDKDKAKADNNILGFIEKPLNKEILLQIFG